MSPLLSRFCLRACVRVCVPTNESQGGADEVWVGVNDSDIITACRLVLFQRADTDRSSIVPALRGPPRLPCVRNHPPTCCSRRGPKTLKPYTESLWAAGTGSDERQCGWRENNKRQAPSILHTAHTHIPAETQRRHTRAQTRKTYGGYRGSGEGLEGVGSV